MSKERYQFPLFDIVNVPFEVEGKIYCYSKFDIIFIDGCPRTLDREMIGDIPDNINKIVLEYVSAFYGLPKELRLAIVSEARENHHIWEKMWAPASVFVGEQYRYQIQLMTLMYNQMCLLCKGASIDRLPELRFWIEKKAGKEGEQIISQIRQKQRPTRSHVRYCREEKDWWDRACETFFGF